MKKANGEDYRLCETEENREEFDTWLERKREQELDPSYEPPDRDDDF